MKAIVFIMLACCVLLLANCSRESNPGAVDNGESGLNPRLAASFPTNPIGPRNNPLIDYIRTSWTSGDTEATGGTHYDHIKLYGHTYSDLNETQAEWVVDHLDMFMGKPEVAEARDLSAYPDMLFGRELANTDRSNPWGTYILETYFLSDSTLNT